MSNHTVQEIDEVDLVEPYDQQGHDETFQPNNILNTGINGLWKPSATVHRVRVIPSDALRFQTYLLADSTVAAPITATQILTKRPQAIAAKVRIQLTPTAGATGRVYLIRSLDEVGSLLLDTAAAPRPYLSNGYYLGDSSVANSLELVTSEMLFAVCLNTGASTGAVISVCSELFFPE